MILLIVLLLLVVILQFILIFTLKAERDKFIEGVDTFACSANDKLDEIRLGYEQKLADAHMGWRHFTASYAPSEADYLINEDRAGKKMRKAIASTIASDIVENFTPDVENEVFKLSVWVKKE